MENNSNNQTCAVCMTDIDQKEGRSILECGHIFHARCLHTHIIRNLSYCPTCNPVSGGIFDGYKQDAPIDKQPFNFGDDYRVNKLTEARKLLIEKYTSNITTSSKKKLMTPKKVAEYFCDQKFYDDDGYSYKALRSAFDSFARNIMDSGTTGPGTEESIMIDNDPVMMITNGINTHDMIQMGHVDAARLVSSKVTIKMLVDNGYNIDDMVLMGVSWKQMLTMGLSHVSTFVNSRASFPILALVTIYGINMTTLYTDVCNGRMTYVAQLKLSSEDMRLLGCTIQTLLTLKLKWKHMARFRESGEFLSTIEGWHRFGFTVHMMRAMKHTVEDYAVFKDGLKFTDQEFEALFNTKPAFVFDHMDGTKKKVTAQKQQNQAPRNNNNLSYNNNNRFSENAHLFQGQTADIYSYKDTIIPRTENESD
jgi:hypothetical protein